nr:MAG TPA: hypothetical protein [Caudoviricetes sp.]
MTDPTHQGPPPPPAQTPTRAVVFCLYGSGEITTGGNRCCLNANAGWWGEGVGEFRGARGCRAGTRSR